MTEAELRDRLAVERTDLANERTLLAYVRTALAVAASGAVLLRFFTNHLALLVTAWALVVLGVAAVGVGIWRFLAVRRRLHAHRT